MLGLDNTVKIASLGGMEAIIQAALVHKSHHAVQEYACLALANLTRINEGMPHHFDTLSVHGLYAIEFSMS
jgi:hypothetical protein